MAHLLIALHVMVVVGSRDAETNLDVHAEQVRTLTETLEAHGVPRDHLTVFWGRGVDDRPDRTSMYELDVEDHWLLHRTPLHGATSPLRQRMPTTFDGIDIRPARRAALQRWLRTRGAALTTDQTLLIVVTGTGLSRPMGDRNGGINLWGQDMWRRDGMAEDLEAVPDGVRVVVWMSQCHAGGFADLHLQRDRYCGAFATPALLGRNPGCPPSPDPELSAQHFVRMLEGLTRHGSIAAASDEAMLTDLTADVPHLTSDAFLRDALARTAEARGAPVTALLEGSGPPRDLAARVAEAHGLGTPPDLPAVLALIERLDAAAVDVVAWRRSLFHAMDEIRGPAADALTDRLAELAGSEDAAARRALREALVATIRARISEDAVRWRTLNALRDRSEAARALQHTLRAQEAAARRTAFLMARDVIPPLLDAADRRTWERLRACEAAPILPGATGGEAEVAARLPAAETLAKATALRPGWIGADVALATADGGVRVVAVQPAGPAAELLEPGDHLLALDDRPLDRPDAFRHAVLLASEGSRLNLAIARDGERRIVTVPVASERPVPRAARCGDSMLALDLKSVSGEVPQLGMGRPVLLGMWWSGCAQCRHTTPAIARWSEAHDVPAVLISLESAELLDRYVARHSLPLPLARVETRDTSRIGYRFFPSWILVDGDGRLAGARMELEDGEIALEGADEWLCLPEPW